jgi:DNA-binding ferritin-like protein
VDLQKVHTNLAEKFDKLADQISGLLALFEMTARSFATHPQIQMAEKDKEFLEKIDKLPEQNKTIAKGLTLMEQKVREKVYGPINPSPARPPQRF